MRKLTEDANPVIEITGAIFTANADRIGAGGLAILSELYKIILVCGGGRTGLKFFRDSM